MAPSSVAGPSGSSPPPIPTNARQARRPPPNMQCSAARGAVARSFARVDATWRLRHRPPATLLLLAEAATSPRRLDSVASGIREPPTVSARGACIAAHAATPDGLAAWLLPRTTGREAGCRGHRSDCYFARRGPRSSSIPSGLARWTAVPFPGEDWLPCLGWLGTKGSERSWSCLNRSYWWMPPVVGAHPLRRLGFWPDARRVTRECNIRPIRRAQKRSCGSCGGPAATVTASGCAL